MVRSSLAALGLTVSVVGFVLFVALGAGAWAARREADRRVEAMAARADTAVDAAARGVGLLKQVIARSEADLTLARSANPHAGRPADPFTRLFVSRAAQELPGGIDQAREVVGTATEAVRVAEAALAVFAEHPEETAALGVREGELDTARGQLQQAASSLGRARGAIGVAAAGASPEQLSAIGEALARAKDVADRLDDTLTRARAGLENARRLAGVWSLWVAIGATVLAVLGAAGQVFMARACWRTLRRPRVDVEPPG
jgi:hypothetical protein